MSGTRCAALLATGGVFLLFAGYAVGRWAKPARVEYRERVVTKTVEVAARQKEETRVEAQSVAGRTQEKWRIREVIRPSGEVVRTATNQVTRESQATRRNEEAKRETEVRYVDRVTEKEVVKVVQADKATWGIGARGGFSSGLRAVYGIEASRRIIGPVWVGAYATTAKEIGAAVRVEW